MQTAVSKGGFWEEFEASFMARDSLFVIFYLKIQLRNLVMFYILKICLSCAKKTKKFIGCLTERFKVLLWGSYFHKFTVGIYIFLLKLHLTIRDVSWFLLRCLFFTYRPSSSRSVNISTAEKKAKNLKTNRKTDTKTYYHVSLINYSTLSSPNLELNRNSVLATQTQTQIR